PARPGGVVFVPCPDGSGARLRSGRHSAARPPGTSAGHERAPRSPSHSCPLFETASRSVAGPGRPAPAAARLGSTHVRIYRPTASPGGVARPASARGLTFGAPRAVRHLPHLSWSESLMAALLVKLFRDV